jgi:dUTP pyrophosphatase
MKVKIKSITGRLPEYARQGDACVDLCYTGEAIGIQPLATITLCTGLFMELPEGCVALICSRSGLASRGVFVANAPGIIDSGYRGEVKVILYNASPTETVIFRKGDRIAQMMIQEVPTIEWEDVEEGEFTITDRGDAGLGSTGI